MGILAIQGKSNSKNILKYFEQKGKTNKWVGTLKENPSEWCYYIDSETDEIECIKKHRLSEKYPHHIIKFLNDIPKENNYELWAY